MSKAILGKKLGMTQVFTAEGQLVPVTVVETTPSVVVRVKTVETDGYEAVQIGYGSIKEKHLTKPVHLEIHTRLVPVALDDIHQYPNSQE